MKAVKRWEAGCQGMKQETGWWMKFQKREPADKTALVTFLKTEPYSRFYIFLRILFWWRYCLSIKIVPLHPMAPAFDFRPPSSLTWTIVIVSKWVTHLYCLLPSSYLMYSLTLLRDESNEMDLKFKFRTAFHNGSPLPTDWEEIQGLPELTPAYLKCTSLVDSHTPCVFQTQPHITVHSGAFPASGLCSATPAAWNTLSPSSVFELPLLHKPSKAPWGRT